ncbi:MAG: class I SAM-dependent methyltransferase [Candidatus Bathyarchaeota archaeon]|nr:MAG: class I SAM-dependent methyltransferase [Candidatus Bathyarchaeota archaeon]
MNEQEWYTSFFDELNEYWVEIVDARSTGKEVEFIESVVTTTEGLVLDLCCGTGRHSISLRRKGWNIVGFDISPNLLRIAKDSMRKSDARFPLVRGEMRYLPFRSETFEAVINMFTSFGYLPSKNEDMKSLKEISRALRPDKFLLIDIANLEHLLKIFQKKDWAEFPNFYLLEKRSLDISDSRLRSQWIFLDKKTGRTRIFRHNLRLYHFQQLRSMLIKVGLVIESVFGGYEKQVFQHDSHRLIVVAKKIL